MVAVLETAIGSTDKPNFADINLLHTWPLRKGFVFLLETSRSDQSRKIEDRRSTNPRLFRVFFYWNNRQQAQIRKEWKKGEKETKKRKKRKKREKRKKRKKREKRKKRKKRKKREKRKKRKKGGGREEREDREEKPELLSFCLPPFFLSPPPLFLSHSFSLCRLPSFFFLLYFSFFLPFVFFLSPFRPFRSSFSFPLFSSSSIPRNMSLRAKHAT